MSVSIYLFVFCFFFESYYIVSAVMALFLFSSVSWHILGFCTGLFCPKSACGAAHLLHGCVHHISTISVSSKMSRWGCFSSHSPPYCSLNSLSALLCVRPHAWLIGFIAAWIPVSVGVFEGLKMSWNLLVQRSLMQFRDYICPCAITIFWRNKREEDLYYNELFFIVT